MLLQAAKEYAIRYVPLVHSREPAPQIAGHIVRWADLPAAVDYIIDSGLQ